MRRCNVPAKREYLGRIFEGGRLGVTVVTETKLKGKAEFNFL